MNHRTVQDIDVFNSPNGAELFPSRTRKYAGRAGYRRFGNAAEAVRFAIEELPAGLLLGAFLEIDETRFDQAGIRALYDSPDYPLPRAANTDHPLSDAEPMSGAPGAIPPGLHHAG